ncbi:glycoside hydrolase family 79 protein [Fistulina hepatica ATCC 64428]|nr:glycoside hydrolase family 79 protein [Fistulina hepatica ATCC 64428]
MLLFLFRAYAFFLLYSIHVWAWPSVYTLNGPADLPADASDPLSRTLASFSIETAFLIDFTGNLSTPNGLTRNLLEGLKSRTGIAPEIRIGGDTADSTYWNASLDEPLSNFIDNGTLYNTTIGPLFWEAVNLFPATTKITLTLNLEHLNYSGALEVARAAWDTLGPEHLIAFEIGNEPDHYGIFTIQSYTDIWEQWSANMSKTLDIRYPEFQLGATADDPLWPYGTEEANAQVDCVSALAAGANNASTVKLCSEHTYQYSVCDAAEVAVATLPNLVNHTRLAMYLDLWQPRIRTLREVIGPETFNIGEFNSVSCAGKDGVSNTFGQALWLLDTAFYAASINVAKVFNHQGGPLTLQSSTQLNHGGLSLYDMWYPVENINGPEQVFPSYSAYLMIAETIGFSDDLRIAELYPGRQANGSNITPEFGDTSDGQLVVYGFWSAAEVHYPVKFAVLNLQIYNSTETNITRPDVTVDLKAFLHSSRSILEVRRLTAPGADVKEANVTTWTGQSYPYGLPVGDIQVESVIGGNVIVEASSAVLVTVSAQSK